MAGLRSMHQGQACSAPISGEAAHVVVDEGARHGVSHVVLLPAALVQHRRRLRLRARLEPALPAHKLDTLSGCYPLVTAL